MSAQPIVDSSPSGTHLTGEHHVLELIATGAPPGDTLDALCRVIDEQSGLMSSVFILDRDGANMPLAAGRHAPEVSRQAACSFHVKPTAGALGIGIAAMRERLHQLVGTLKIESSDRGTTVRAEIPLPPDVP